MKVILMTLLFLPVIARSQTTSYNCDKARIKWVKDEKIKSCPFVPPPGNAGVVTSVEIGNNIDRTSSRYHCYYVETKICDTNDCKECNEKYVFDLMVSNKKFIAPTKETGVVKNCSPTLAEIPLYSYNPIITTVHDGSYAITNYTVFINRNPKSASKGHALHPGKVQRTIFKTNGQIFVATMGEGTGDWRYPNEILASTIWGAVDELLIAAFKCKNQSTPTLFLFDVSGSMNENNKWMNAKQAAISTIDFLFTEAAKNKQLPAVGLMSYSGGCIDNPTSQLLNFSTDKTVIKNAISNNLPSPSGGTPTPQAILNAEAFLKQQLQMNNQCEGDLVILTDGQSSCGAIRPPGTFSQVKKTVQVACQAGTGSFRLRYQTIGFDIAAGSDAEKDLQYLSSLSGGRYYHAGDMPELQKAFEKISRVFVPIGFTQSTSPVSAADKKNFRAAVDFVKTKNYDTAHAVFKTFHVKYPSDSAGLFNYAQMCEATDQYKLAALKYSAYLAQNPNVPDRETIEAGIEKMNAYYKEHFRYQKEVVRKDLEFLNQYFKRLMTGQAIPLATEFTGFINERDDLYTRLTGILGTSDPAITTLCREIVGSFGIAKRRIVANSQGWDQNAVPVISTLYLQMERLNALIRDIELQ